MRSRAIALGFLALTACGGAARTTAPSRVAEAERTQRSVAREELAKTAPEAVALAETELRLAKAAAANDDATGAELHADRAIAAYRHAAILARVARANAEAGSARDALAKASEQLARYAEQRRAMDAEADDLEKQLKIARDAQLPAASGPAEPEREKARLVAAQSLVTQARLLCGAARLVSPEAPGLAESEATATDLDKKLDATRGPVPIDAVARARAACLASLTKARRANAASADATDALLSELAQSFSAPPPSPSAAKRAPTPPQTTRDERGVVVTLRSAYSGEELTPDAAASLEQLGRVAAAHPTFGVQVVLHDTAEPKGAALEADEKRLAAASRVLTSAGAAKVVTFAAGSRAPVVDPSDAKRRDQNARLEVVFVAP